MKNIRTYFSQYYVPNNMAICISGDFDPDVAIKLVDKYFGGLKSSPVPVFKFEKEEPINAPIVKEVIGPDAENITLAYRFDGANSKDADMIAMLDMVLTNGNAGLIDINLNKKQKVLSSGSGPEVMKDYSYLSLTGKPKTGQTLDEVKDLLLSQIELLKKGDFPDWMLPAIINDLRLRTIKDFETNRGRANSFVETFILGENWKDFIETTDRLSKITKQDIVNFAKQNLNNNYVVVYKRTGKDKDVVKVRKPKITPIKINRDLESDFVKNINESKVPAIEPVFVDYKKDIQKQILKNNIQLNYKENVENKTFELYYVFNMGSNNDKKLSIAIQYLKYLGTSKFTPEQISEEFYKIGCSFNVSNSSEQVNVSLSGLSENFEKGLKLFESLLSDPQPNKEAFDNLITDILKKRQDAKLNVRNIFSNLVTYGYYGPKSPITNILSETELKALTPAELIQKIKELCSFEHHVLFYGDIPTASLVKTLDTYHQTPAKLQPILPETKFVELPTTENKVYHADFTMKQIQLMMLQKGDGAYDKTKEPIIKLFNEYFGGSMNSIVFQELREARALAYSASSTYRIPSRSDKAYWGTSYIATQTDKMGDALKGLNDLLNNMPESEKAFNLAKEAIMQNLRTSRVTKSAVLWSYESAKKLGLDYDVRKDVFSKVPTYTFSDVKAFEENTLKNKPHSFMVLGDKKDIDFNLLSKYGKIAYLTLEEIFGY
ncbi:MAG: insulinase family protein [Bacteroidota bacterium]